MAAVTIKNLTFSYSTEHTSLPATLKNLNLTFPSGKFSLLIGPSGTGKSTLLKLLANLYPAFRGRLETGTILYDDQSLADMQPSSISRMVALMFQDPDQQFAMDTVENEIIFALENLQVAPEQISAAVERALEFVDITNLRHRVLSTLSGGEKQKVALAIIVAMDSDVILLDEPFASIDRGSRQFLLNRLAKLRDDAGKTIILADHNLSDYQDLVDAVFELDPAAKQITRLSDEQAENRFANFDHQLSPVKLGIPTAEENQVLHLSQLTLATPRETLVHVDSLGFAKGKITLLTGENGSGKSTLFNAITRLGHYQGQITYLADDIQKIRLKRYAMQVGLMFQDAQSQFLGITVDEELAISKKASHHPDYYTDSKITEMLTTINLSGRGDQVVYSLSEGQKKKLQLLEMLIVGSPVLLLDEPLKGLDLKSVTEVATFIATASHELGQTFIIISHQLTGLAAIVDYHLTLANQTLTYEEELK